MTSEKLKPTPGPWTFNTSPQPNGCPTVGSKGLMVCMVAHSINYPDQRDQALGNATLIAEAGTVFHECGLSPRELLEGYRDMYRELREIAQYPENDTVEMRRIANFVTAKHKEV